MPGHVTYARFNPWVREVHERELPGLDGRVLVFDVVGERRTAPLRERLLQVPRGVYDVALLRGCTGILREDIESGASALELDDFFPDPTLVGFIDVFPSPHIKAFRGDGTLEKKSGQLIRAARESELSALLEWSEAIWTPKDFHFLLPSGDHADRFVRVADAFMEPLNIERVADWISYRLRANSYLFVDSPTILPLLQALEIRSLRNDPDGNVSKRLLPLYSIPPERVSLRFAELERWQRDHNRNESSVISIVSVNATGGYLDRFSQALKTVKDPFPIEQVILCDTGSCESGDVLCHVDTHRHKASDCNQESPALEVDNRRFTTQVVFGVQVTNLPPYDKISDQRPIIQDLDGVGAFRVHVQRQPNGDHLGAYIDTQRIFESHIFSSLAKHRLLIATSGWKPDVVLVPRHPHTDVIRRWLAETAFKASRSESRPVTLERPNGRQLSQLTGFSFVTTVSSPRTPCEPL
jgi:hypothetical protein